MQDERCAVIHPKLRVEQEIGRGSFGVVFRAHQLTVARDVAVKVLHPGVAPANQLERQFLEEIRAIGRIKHDNVVQIFDADEAVDGRPYFVMELLQGHTLQQLADDGMAPTLAIKLVAQLLDGLAAVHAAGHIHADVKPANAVVCGVPGRERVVLIDFGFSCLHQAGGPSEAVGGTRAYMAPEQLQAWKVTPASDVFSAALVLVKLLTGRHRQPDELVPSLDGITDPAVLRALDRALAEDAARRPSAADFARALRGGKQDAPPPPGLPPPFRELAPLTEDDRGRLCGRANDVVRLARRIENSRAVVLTAPSGTGKTSLLRAGVIPYLDAAGIPHLYLACGADVQGVLASQLGAEPRLVVILDQIEVAIAGGEASSVLRTLFAAIARSAVRAIVLGVREDFVARLLAAAPELADGVPQVRLPPLDLDGARDALRMPLREHRVAIHDDLLARLLADLSRAGSEMGLAGAIYPPHLQLAGAALFDVRAPSEPALTLAHYRRLGGFAAIVEEHLTRTLGELVESERAIARELLLVLVTSSQTRALRSEAELIAAVSTRHDEPTIQRVLTRLEARRLLVRTSGPEGAASWSLVHDTLAPRIAAWITVQDLDRRRAAEMLRFQLRRSKPELPAVLTARQLAELHSFPGLLDELEREWGRRAEVWSPRSLVTRSHKMVRYRRAVLASALAAVLALTAMLAINWLDERAQHRQAIARSELNLGRIDLTLQPFDWARRPDGTLVLTPVNLGELAVLDWQLFEPSPEDPDEPAQPIGPPRMQRGTRADQPTALVETGIEVRGGDAFLRVTGRGRRGETCAPVLVPLHHLLGNAQYTFAHRVVLRVPTCRATDFDMQVVPDGPFIAGGLGVPPAHVGEQDVEPRTARRVPAFAIDRTEISNDAFEIFASAWSVHDVQAEDYPAALAVAGGPRFPRGSIDWFDARAYCRYLGKDLPTQLQWQKALRGGLVLTDGSANPAAERNVPWTDAPAEAPDLAAIVADAPAPEACPQCGKLGDPRKPSPVGAHTADVSPYGVADLAGNVQEWTLDAEIGLARSAPRNRPRVTRGGNWFDTRRDLLVDYMVAPNLRTPHLRHPYLGARCARWLTP
ncbi:MAG TPA: SUMF1/EgtB/PvdO family nonheme iron enzyme [Kofleriaceae bacterium]|nr:SUMF1/EgtB/PvdO family nonheme iron enzyme [Kofleriaceae bacterium]